MSVTLILDCIIVLLKYYHNKIAAVSHGCYKGGLFYRDVKDVLRMSYRGLRRVLLG